MANPTVIQKVTGTVAFTKQDGSPGQVDGLPVWTSSDEAIGSIQNVSPDGMSAEVHGVSAGTITITVIGDADLGSGVRPLQATGEVTFTAEEATSATVSFSEPQDRDPALRGSLRHRR